MKKQLYISTLLMTLLAVIITTPVQGQLAPSEEILMTARPTGMGRAFTAVADDSQALYYNPAGLALYETNELTFTTFRKISQNFGMMNFVTRYKDIPLGIGLAFVEVDGGTPTGYTSTTNVPGQFTEGRNFNNRTWSLHAATAFKLSQKVAIGVKAKAISIELNDETDLIGAIDLSTYAQITPELSIGMSLDNALTGILTDSDSNDEVLRTAGRFGIAYLLWERWLFAADFTTRIATKENSADSFSNMGTEYWFNPHFALRAGMLSDDDETRLSLGTGLRLGALVMDIAWQENTDEESDLFSDSIIFTVGFRIDGVPYIVPGPKEEIK